MDQSIVLILGIIGLGFFISNKSKSGSRLTEDFSKVRVYPNENPSMTNIYNSNYAEEIDQQLRKNIAAGQSKQSNQIIETFASVESEINPLTGQPYVRTHNNMQPFFAGNTKQNMSENGSETLLGLATGRDPTFQKKQVLPGKITGSNTGTNVQFMSQLESSGTDERERFLTDLKKQSQRLLNRFTFNVQKLNNLILKSDKLLIKIL